MFQVRPTRIARWDFRKNRAALGRLNLNHPPSSVGGIGGKLNRTVVGDIQSQPNIEPRFVST
jgi:hypothetical protein